MNAQLLSRDEFRTAVFLRDGGRCVLCGGPGADAHHIVDRKLFPDGGYYLDNGATLCEGCHLQAETSSNPEFLPSRIRETAGIASVVLPPGLDPGAGYDKWGRPIVSGPIRYPKTPHLPWSPGYDAQEDMVLESTDHWTGVEVVITEKMDGECTTLARDYMHARSPNYGPHPSRTKVRAMWGRIRHEIPDAWRLCLENVSARHSIKYVGLPSYFLVFSIWDQLGTARGWDDTEEWCQLLGLHTVPVLWRGTWDRQACCEVIAGLDLDGQEGIVVRPAGGFRWGQIADPRAGVLGKWVRKGHVTTDQHWMERPVEWNGLRKGA